MKALCVLLIGLVMVGVGLGSGGCKQEVAVQRTAVEEKEDERISELVKEALASSPTFKYPDVQVSTHRGTVQLSGFVLTDEQKRAAGEAAKAVPGVVEVENKISIKE